MGKGRLDELGSAEDRTARNAIGEFLNAEIMGGAVLLAAAFAALVWVNAGGSESYASFWGHDLALDVGKFHISLDTRGWVNDGLMTFFFFVVGLEIKRELVIGELADRRSALLPVLAALGGIAVPAVIYVVVTLNSPYGRGWAIPMATDIAFAVGALALLSRFVPPSIRLFLLALAIVDDIAAIVVIAFFFGGGIDGWWLFGAALALVIAAAIRAAGVRHEVLFLVTLGVAWLLLLRSGVHATLAGVSVAMLVPARPAEGRDILRSLEHYLHPWVSFGIVPLFALANAGVLINASTLRFAAGEALTWGIVLGLVIGKPLGITAGAGIAVWSRAAKLPAGASWRHIIGAGALGGIGFTVSLILVTLSVESQPALEAAKLAVLTASAAAAVIGALIFIASRDRESAAESPISQ